MTNRILDGMLFGFIGCSLLVFGFLILTPDRVLDGNRMDSFLFYGALYIIANGWIFSVIAICKLWAVAFGNRK